MKRTLVAAAGLMVSGVAFADNLQGIDRLLCAVGQVVACVEEADCYPIPPSEVDVPEFVIVDVKGKLLSTTKASERNRRTRRANRAAEPTGLFIYKVSILGARSAS